MNVHYSSESGEWETPQDLFDLLNKEFGFQLDVCASAGNAKCLLYYDRETDGLAQDWRGRCWMNPPYGREIGKWVAKARHTAEDTGATVVCLLPARTDTAWWWDHVVYGEVRFLRGRLRFVGAEGSAPFPSAVVIFGPYRRRRTTRWWDTRLPSADLETEDPPGRSYSRAEARQLLRELAQAASQPREVRA